MRRSMSTGLSPLIDQVDGFLNPKLELVETTTQVMRDSLKQKLRSVKHTGCIF